MGATDTAPARAFGSVLRPRALLYLYRARLRVDAAQELLAGLGVAVAVPLLSAPLLAGAGAPPPTEQVVRAVTGPADLQVRARSADGFDEGLLHTVKRLPGVEQAAPLLEQSATIYGPHGSSVTVDVAGTDPTLAILNGLAH